MKVFTKELQALVAKVQKGIGNNPLMPLSGLVSVSYDGEKKVTLKTFDGYNYVISNADIGVDSGTPFEACVNANTFVSLVNKTSSEYIDVELEPQYVSFRGNGKYKLDVVMDNGSLLRFPEMENYDGVPTHKVGIDVLSNSILVNEPSASKTAEVPMFLGCYFGKRVYTTDGHIACVVDATLMEDSHALFMYSTMRLLPSFSDKEATLAIKEANGETLFMLADSTVSVYGKLIADEGKYPVDALDGMVSAQMPCVKVKVGELLDVLDRMNIFTDQYQTNAIRLFFKGETLTITNYASGNAYNAQETLDATYADQIPHTGDEEYECFVDLSQLQADLRVCDKQEAIIGYGSKSFIRVVEGNATFVIGLLNPEERKGK